MDSTNKANESFPNNHRLHDKIPCGEKCGDSGVEAGSGFQVLGLIV
jgi:hypothetical protein